MSEKHLSSPVLWSMLILAGLFSACGVNIHNLNSDNRALASYTARRILQNEKTAVQSKDLDILLEALHSQNQLIRSASVQAFSQNPQASYVYIISLLSNQDYTRQKLEQKHSLALTLFNQFPDSLEKVEYLSIVLRQISAYDLPLARSLISKVEAMKERIPEGQTQDLGQIEIFQTCMQLHQDTTNTLNALQQIVKTQLKKFPEPVRQKLFSHILHALWEVQPIVPQELWDSMESTARGFESLKRRADSLVLLARVFAGYDPERALAFLLRISTGWNGEQYTYLIQNLDLLPEYRTAVLEKALEMASGIQDKTKRQNALLEIALLGTPSEYYLIRRLVTMLEEDDLNRSRLLAHLALSQLKEQPGRAEYLASLIVSDTNRLLYYYQPAMDILAVSSSTQAQSLLSVYPDDPVLAARYKLAVLAPGADNLMEYYNQSLGDFRAQPPHNQELIKQLIISKAAAGYPDLAYNLLSRNIQAISRLEKEQDLETYLSLWLPALVWQAGLSSHTLNAPLQTRIQKMTNDTLQAQYLYRLAALETSQDIRDIAAYYAYLSPEQALELLQKWLYRDIYEAEVSLIRSLVSKKVNLQRYTLNKEALPLPHLAVLIRGLEECPNTNFTADFWDIAFDKQNSPALRKSALGYYRFKPSAELLNRAVTTLTNNQMPLIQKELLKVLQAHHQKINWSSLENDLISILNSRDSSAGKKELSLQLCRIGKILPPKDVLEKILNQDGSASLKMQAVRTVSALGTKAHASLLVRLLREEAYAIPALEAIEKLQAFSLLTENYSTLRYPDIAAEFLRLYQPQLQRNTLTGYTGFIIPQVWYIYQQKGYQIRYYSTREDAEKAGCSRILEAVYKTEYNEEIDFSNNQAAQKILKSEYHALTLREWSKAGSVQWEMKATGYGSPWSEEIVEGPGDPQQKIHNLARRITLRELERQLDNLEYRIPFNFES